MISHGAAAFLKERLMDHSDAYRVHVCNICGLIAIANLKNNQFQCRGCSNTTEVRTQLYSDTQPRCCSSPIASTLSGLSSTDLTDSVAVCFEAPFPGADVDGNCSQNDGIIKESERNLTATAFSVLLIRRAYEGKSPRCTLAM